MPDHTLLYSMSLLFVGSWGRNLQNLAITQTDTIVYWVAHGGTLAGDMSYNLLVRE